MYQPTKLRRQPTKAAAQQIKKSSLRKPATTITTPYSSPYASLPYYGNYCGPNWSAGEYQPSVDSDVPSLDVLDNECRLHDASFANLDNIKDANNRFIEATMDMGPLGFAMGAMVQATRPGEPRFRGSTLTPGGGSLAYYGNNHSADDINYNIMTKPTKQSTANKAKAKSTRSINQPKPPVSMMSMAPVSIGNTIRGQPSKTIQVAGGHRVIGRDFAFTSGATVAAATGWSLVGGAPITPAAFPSTILRNYTQMYAQFTVNKLTIHYITSSPTSQSGDIMFYYEPDREAPMVDITNNSFIPYVVSNPYSVLGPQWTNHSMDVTPKKVTYSTSYGLGTDIESEACGSVFLFSKTSSANSPGYVLMDYDITFHTLSVNPRAGLLPVTRAQWSQITLGKTTLAATSGTTLVTAAVQGVNQDGSASALPTGAQSGDIYKVILLPTNSVVSGVNAAWTNATTANLILLHQSGSNSTAVTIDDGYTLYGCYANSGFYLYGTYANALTDTNQLYYGVTATITYNLCCYISLLASNSSFSQSSY